MLVQEYNVWDKILFGTDYPVTTVAETVAGLRSLVDVRIDRFSLPGEQIEQLINRDALALLGLSDFRSQLNERRPRVSLFAALSLSLSKTDWAVVGVYSVAMVGLGLYFSRAATKSARRLPHWRAELAVVGDRLRQRFNILGLRRRLGLAVLRRRLHVPQPDRLDCVADLDAARRRIFGRRCGDAAGS